MMERSNEACTAEEVGVPERMPEPPLGADAIKQCSLNSQDGLRQYSLTPHPSALPREFLEQQRTESAMLLNRCVKSKIIRFVGIEIRLPDGSPYSFTPNKPIIRPPLLDTSLLDIHKRASWQISLSPGDPIRARPLPSQGIVLLKLKSDVYGGLYDDEDFVQGPSENFYLIPLNSSAGHGEDMHPVFNHVQIVVNRRSSEASTEDLRVSRVSLMYIPESELGDQEALQVEPTSPPIVFPILAANFMNTESAHNKRKHQEDQLSDSGLMPPSIEDTPPEFTSKRIRRDDKEDDREIVAIDD